MATEKLCEENGYWLMFVQVKLLRGVERGVFVAMETKRAQELSKLKNPTALDFSEKDTISYLIGSDIDEAKKNAIEYFKRHFVTERAMSPVVRP